MATNWLGTGGSTAGQMVGTYYGGPIGGYLGGYTGGILGNAIGDAGGLEDTSGGMVDEWGQGGGGAGDFFGSIFGGGAPQRPVRRLMTQQDLLNQAARLLPQMAASEVAYNQALAPGLTDVQLGVEQQIAPGTFNLRRDALAARQRDLNLGYSLPPELQDLVTTNALQQLGASGVGASDLGKLFGARSIAGAGLDRGEARIQNALAASQYRPMFNERQPYGGTPGLSLMGDVRGVEAFDVNQAMLNQQRAENAEAQRNQEFTALLNQAAVQIKGASGNNPSWYERNTSTSRRPTSGVSTPGFGDRGNEWMSAGSNQNALNWNQYSPY